MTDFTLHHHTAKICGIARDNFGLFEITATGVLTFEALQRLTAQAAPHLQSVTALVIRLDAALLTIDMADWPIRQRSALREPPVALVVSPEAHASAIVLCKQLAEAGLIRAVFLPSQLALAYRWAARHAVRAHQAAPE